MWLLFLVSLLSRLETSFSLCRSCQLLSLGALGMEHGSLLSLSVAIRHFTGRSAFLRVIVVTMPSDESDFRILLLWVLFLIFSDS